MVSIIEYNGGANTYVGLSTDAKPSDAGNGSTFIEMNTGKVFMYNAEGNAWVEVQ